MTFEFPNFREWIEENNNLEAKELLTKQHKILDELENDYSANQYNELCKVDKALCKVFQLYEIECERKLRNKLSLYNPHAF